ncbi:cytochrome P450 [Actinokineospora enzanensis]|uniref:cytochrome P450 n=1 Tax=Actinokineospora enzanensis TaxID=155975 RepID=UPI000366C04B|nr:cytochrome P450 [Actinokineospora enzanensis]
MTSAPPRQTGQLPPGPKGSRFAQTGKFVRGPIEFLAKAHAEFGDIFKVTLVGMPPIVYVADPDLVRQVFATDRSVGNAGRTRQDFLQRMVGDNSILVLDGDEWLRQRKMIGSAFHTRYLQSYQEQIREIANESIDTWDTGVEFPLRPKMQIVALDVLLRVVFGIKDLERVAQLREMLPRLTASASSMETLAFVLSRSAWAGIEPIFRRIPGSAAAKFSKARADCDAVLYDEIRRRRAEPDNEQRKDIMSQLLRATDDDGTPMTDLELRDALMTLLEAGYETTAAAMAWVFERLVRQPEVYRKLVDECATGDEAYLEAVIKETMRTRPIVPVMPRALSGDLEIAGYRIPSGWWVAPSVPLLHSREESFASPDEFRPERFLGDDVPKSAFVPFGGGRRHCLGAQFAMIEMKAVIPEVVRRMTLRAAPGSAPEQQKTSHVLLTPSRGASVIAEPREVPAT